MEPRKRARQRPPKQFHSPVKEFIDRGADIVVVHEARPPDPDDPGAPPTITQTIRLNRYLHSRLEALATQEQRSFAWVVRDILLRHFQGNGEAR